MTTTAYAVTVTDVTVTDATATDATVTDATVTDAEPGESTVPERPAAHGPLAPHLDDPDAYCPDAGMWAPVQDLFCEFCGAADHDLR